MTDNTTQQSTLSNNITTVSADDVKLTIVDIIAVLKKFRILIVGVAATIIVGSIYYAFNATPIYRAEITIAPARGQPAGLGGIVSQFGGAFSGLASLAGMGSGSGSSRLLRGEAFRTLTSTSYIQDFIKEGELLPILFSNKWDAEKNEWAVDSEESIPTLSDGYDLFMGQILRTEEDTTTSIITLGIEWKDPQIAAQWANELVGKINARLRAKAIVDTDKTIDYLNQELEKSKSLELRQAIFYMLEQQIGSKTSARVRDDFAFKIINPALPPDIDKYVRPKKIQIVFFGIVGGFVAGVFSAFLAYAFSRLRDDYRNASLEPD